LAGRGIGHGRRLFRVPARGRPHQPLPDRRGRHVPGRYGREAIIRGGWLGQGPGEGSVKRILPDSHTDFVFSVLPRSSASSCAACWSRCLLSSCCAGCSARADQDDVHPRFAVSRSVAPDRFAVDSINIGVNLQLLPAKGMTLPLFSYGGSSMIAVALTAGFDAGADPAQAGKPGAAARDSTGLWRAWRRNRIMTKTKLFLLSAGGTGGHLFPAEALAHELTARGHRVHLVTDSRAERFAGKFPASDIHVVRSATIGRRTRSR
jgi:hypothetical protein